MTAAEKDALDATLIALFVLVCFLLGVVEWLEHHHLSLWSILKN